MIQKKKTYINYLNYFILTTDAKQINFKNGEIGNKVNETHVKKEIEFKDNTTSTEEKMINICARDGKYYIFKTYGKNHKDSIGDQESYYANDRLHSTLTQIIK